MREVATVVGRRFTPLILIGALLILGSLNLAEAIAPDWSYRVEDITCFAMSRNGEHVIIACEEGQFSIFDRYGNLIMNNFVENEITTVDIANNGTFLVETSGEFFFCSNFGRTQVYPNFGNIFRSVSMSENGEMTIVGTNRGILIFDRNGLLEETETSKPVNFTATSASGQIAAAATTDTIFLYERSSNTQVEYNVIANPLDLAVSDDGSIVVCGLATGAVMVLDPISQRMKVLYTRKFDIIALGRDGKHIFCGSREGELFCLKSSGEEIWSKNVENVITDISISSDGNLIAVLSVSIILLDFSGNELQEIESPNAISHMHTSKSGDILSYTSSEGLYFVTLRQLKKVSTHEYPYSSRKSIPLESSYVEAWSFNRVINSVSTADINNDGFDEILFNSEKTVAALSSQGRVLWEKHFNFRPGFCVMDVTGDFVPEIIVSSADNRMALRVLNGKGEELNNYEFYHRWYSSVLPQQYSIGIHPLWSSDIDDDGFIEVICLLSAGYSLEPRGFYAFEYPSFEEEWYYPTASYVTTVNFVDIDGDGKIDILAGSNAPCNGRQVGNTDDCHAYVFALTLEGEELWMKQVGDQGYKRVDVAVADLDGNGKQDIIGGGWSFYNDWGTLFVLDSKGNYVLGEENRFGQSVFLEAVADLDNDGKMEILVSSGSQLIIFDHRLNMVRSKAFSMKLGGYTQVTINDIDADDEKEIILTSEDPKLLILNSNLDEEWSETFPNHDVFLKAFVVNLQRCKNYLLVLSDKLYVYTFLENPYQPCMLLSLEDVRKEIEDHIAKGDVQFEMGNYEEAMKEYDLAIAKLQQLGDSRTLPEVSQKRTMTYEYSVRFARAEQLLSDGKYSLELEDLQSAEDSILKAKEIYSSINRLDKIQEADNVLDTISQLRSAEEHIAEGDKSRSQEDYKGAIEQYESAMLIYRSLGMTGKEAEVQGLIEDTARILENINTMGKSMKITEIFFLITVVFTTFFFLNRKAYKGEERRINTIIYLFTILSLTGALMILLSSLSTSMGSDVYVLAFSTCLFLVMILGAYLRRS
jgi:tetratricopeptide (TPR) repeat protein